RGHFPAIDVTQSVSRVMNQVVPKERIAVASRVRALLAAHREAEDLLAVGAYRKGFLPRLDEALERMPRLETFLRQSLGDSFLPDQVAQELDRVLGELT